VLHTPTRKYRLAAETHTPEKGKKLNAHSLFNEMGTAYLKRVHFSKGRS
jgi:hypothetical protein